LVNVDGWWDSLVRDRFQAILELVLAAISDDYATVAIILQIINELEADRDPKAWPARSAAPVSPPEVIKALQELTREGYAQACVFESNVARAVKFRADATRDMWFCASPKGASAVKKLLGEE
jgi:hypothetical protein